MTSLSTLVLERYPRGDAVKRTSGSTGAQHNTEKLEVMAVGILIDPAASGTIALAGNDGVKVIFADGALAKGVWHAMKIAQVFDTDTTLTDAQFHLGYAKY